MDAAAAFETLRVATGLSRPVFLTAPPGDSNRVFVVEQHSGRIEILQRSDWSLNDDPFLDLSGLSTGNEQGLLGLAFHPDYATNGFFYVYITDPTSRVLRFQVSAMADVANAASEAQVMEFSQPSSNHNGGWIGFGSDDYLYIATGDGGGGNDDDAGHTPGIGNGQDITNNLLGKILRIDVDSDDFSMDLDQNYGIPAGNPFVGMAGDDEIWVYGLRNPWRPSFDRGTGDFYIADVGQGRCEEVSLQLAASDGGENYGWRLREGVIATPAAGIGGPLAGKVDPIMDYPHPATAGSEPCSAPGAGFTGRSITGGYVYRGPIAELAGRYFFADFFGTSLWSLVFDGSLTSEFDGGNYTDLSDHAGDPGFTPDVGSFGNISSFGEDSDANLYVLDLIDGEVFFIPEPSGELQLVAGFAGLLALFGARRSRG
ncbi:MAG: PQQ-dependent sugar dehydrogenase [Deltaproteobacteria bacterium]|nr:PQQ-dependent sugar dehydrogenase [Deltaproteobacteria bacterium]